MDATVSFTEADLRKFYCKNCSGLGGWVDAEPLGIANEDGSMQYGNHSFEKCEKCDGTGWNRAGRKHFRQVKELRDGARKE